MALEMEEEDGHGVFHRAEKPEQQLDEQNVDVNQVMTEF